MYITPQDLTDDGLVMEHAKALREVRRWQNFAGELAWHMSVRRHLKIQLLKNEAAALEARARELRDQIERGTSNENSKSTG